MNPHRTSEPSETMSIKALLERILADGRMTFAEHKSLQAQITADGIISPEEREQINRLWQAIKSGKVQVIHQGVDAPEKMTT